MRSYPSTEWRYLSYRAHQRRAAIRHITGICAGLACMFAACAGLVGVLMAVF